MVLALVEQFSWVGGPLPRQRAGLRRRVAPASWAYLFRLIKLLSSSSPEGGGGLGGGGGGGGDYSESYMRGTRFLTRWDKHNVVKCLLSAFHQLAN